MAKEKNNFQESNKAYVLSADMGYGHQRAAYPFISIAEGGIITINDYDGISEWEKKYWSDSLKQYELLSYFKKVPLLGNLAFSVMDFFQKIPPFYPHRDLSKPSIQEKFFYQKIEEGVGKNLIERLNKNPLPLISTFFVGAYCAEYYNYKGEIYLVVCDADVSRSWAPLEPENTRIKFLVPNHRVKDRLILYGVKRENIIVTGFPLPTENIGGVDQEILKKDLRQRLEVLDPRGIYRNKYAKLVEAYLCPLSEMDGPTRPITLTFAVGGAGAQRDLGVLILRRLKNKLMENKVRFNLVAGSRQDVFDYYTKVLKDLFLHNNENVKIIFDKDKMESFKKLNVALRTSDVLWTKPSELSFYAGLGLPIIMTQPIGSQEEYNRRWLLGIGAAVDTKNPNYVDEWLFDFLTSGWLAEAAMRGFLNGPRNGTDNIEDIVLRNKIHEVENVHLL
ncbi:MAG: hypothetical protein WCK37_03955 [Candidatus Falkowbacteria bacterium]